MPYTTIRQPAHAEFTEKRSRFIGHIFPVTQEEEANERIAGLRREYWDANHHVYAYILRDGNRRRCSDDGEPQGTAGVPVLEVLSREGLTDVCAVVTRYFGGVLLGAGGLLRAYTRGAKMAADAADRRTLQECAEFSVDLDYGIYGPLSRLLPKLGAEITDSVFEDTVRLRLRMPVRQKDAFLKQLQELSAGSAAPRFIGETLAELPRSAF